MNASIPTKDIAELTGMVYSVGVGDDMRTFTVSERDGCDWHCVTQGYSILVNESHLTDLLKRGRIFSARLISEPVKTN